MKNHNGNYAKIVTIGSGNIEYVMQLGGEFRIGKKNQVDSTELLGGSCINYSLRLMNAGFDVFPIPSIGKDLIGLSIQNKLLNTGFKNGASKESIEFIKSEDFLYRTSTAPIPPLSFIMEAARFSHKNWSGWKISGNTFKTVWDRLRPLSMEAPMQS